MSTNGKKKIIVVLGPTASGKSDFAVKLAKSSMLKSFLLTPDKSMKISILAQIKSPKLKNKVLSIIY